MKREQFPSSRENVDHLISVAESGDKLDANQKKALRDYLAGCVSSNKHTEEVADKIDKIRKILGYQRISREEKLEPQEDEWTKMQREMDENPIKNYQERTTVNGIEISVGWDRLGSYNDYSIYFPQIDLSHAWENEEGVSDQVLRISQRRDVAKRVFDHAVELAGDKSLTVYDIYRKVAHFSADLPYDLEDEEGE